MTEKQATDRAEILNKTKYKKSRIKVKPVRFGKAATHRSYSRTTSGGGVFRSRGQWPK